MRIDLKMVAVATGIASLLLFSGCGKAAEKIGEKAAEKSIEAASGGSANVDVNGGSINVESEDGSFRTSGDVPKEWPQDVPLPDTFESMTSGSVDMGGKVTLTVGGEVAMSSDEIERFYRDGLDGWKETMAITDAPSKARLITFEKDGRQVVVNVIDSGKMRSLALSYSGPA